MLLPSVPGPCGFSDCNDAISTLRPTTKRRDPVISARRVAWVPGNAMKIDINDTWRQLCGSPPVWVLLKLDLCSITAILHPRIPHAPLPAHRKPAGTFASVATILFIRAASQPRLRDVAAQRQYKEKRNGRKRERERRRRNAFCRAPMHQHVSRSLFQILYPRAISFFPASSLLYTSIPASTSRRICTPGRFIPVERRATWIISIFAPAKVSRRDYRDATRFHPR